MKKNRLGKPWGELREELHAENPGMEQDVAVFNDGLTPWKNKIREHWPKV